MMSLFRADENHSFKGPHQDTEILHSGTPRSEAEYAMIMIHGRGATAQSILDLSKEFSTDQKIHYLAPQAKGYTWYPYSFLEPTDRNEPGLSSGLQLIYDLITLLESEGIPKEKIYLLGFSQGGCLASEFVARHPAQYAGLIALSGGLIGDKVDQELYEGDLRDMPYFVGCSDVDPHIPVERVDITAEVFDKLKARVNKQIYPGMGHLVNSDEISHINQILS